MQAASTRRSERRIVSMRPLKSWRSSWIDDAKRESICASGSSTSCRRTRSMAKPFVQVDRALPWRPSTRLISPSKLAGQELVGRDFVDLGQAQQPRNRDRPLAALVRTQYRGLELEASSAPRRRGVTSPSDAGSPGGARRRVLPSSPPAQLPRPAVDGPSVDACSVLATCCGRSMTSCDRSVR